MSRLSHLVTILSLAACGHPHTDVPEPVFAPPAAAPTAPVAAPTPTPEPAPLVELPVELPVESPVDPVAEPAPPPAPTRARTATKPATAKPQPLFKKKCNPQSRAGCRWEKARDEREQPRVRKVEDDD